jgi:hypothetical protein
LPGKGVADQKPGKEIDPANAGRRDYLEAYQTSAADAQADKLSDGLREHLAAQPLDGSADLAKTAEDYYRKEIGKGTGDPVYDARMLSQFSRSAEAMVAQFQQGPPDHRDPEHDPSDRGYVTPSGPPWSPCSTRA